MGESAPPSQVPPSAPSSQSDLSLRERVVLDGIAGSAGVAFGRALVIAGRRNVFVRRTIAREECDEEVARVRASAERSQAQIRAVAGAMPQGSRTAVPVLEAYLLMLDDPMLHDRVERKIRRDRKCAEWAVHEARDDLSRLFADADKLGKDSYIAERVHDVEFVCDMLLRTLAGDTSPFEGQAGASLGLSEPMVIIARDLSPADTAGMAREPVLGFVTEVGSRTSHTSIMARALEIPSVVGVKDATRAVRTGDPVIVCGLTGTVTINPTPEDHARADARRLRHRARTDRLLADGERASATACGTPITLWANLELPAEAPLAKRSGADGVGLYRTEFLYVDRADLPTEDEQYEAYTSVVRAFEGGAVTLRTFDIGGDKFASTFRLPPEMNPALGLRAIRLALAEPEVFSVQLRAMVRASAHGPVRVLIPMVSTTTELRAARTLLRRAEADVAEREGREPIPLPLGAMIEVPAAVMMADVLARQVDFFSLGTNDLVQYALAVDRTSRSLAHLATPFDPSILRLVALAVRAAADKPIPLSVCGAMASEPLAACLLIGLGVRELSMEASAIPIVKEALSRVTVEELRACARVTLEATEVAEVHTALERTLGKRLADLGHVYDER